MPKTWSAIRPYFTRAAVAHIATLLPDGAPHSVPVWALGEGEHLAFFTMTGSRKDRDLQADPRVAVSVTNPDDPLDMAFVRGRATQRIEGDDAWPIIDRIAQTYTGEPYDIRSGMVVFLITPETSWARDYTG